MSQLPCNYGLLDAARLGTAAKSSNSLGGGTSNSSSGLQQRLDESKLQLSCTVLGSGTTGQVVLGTIQGTPVRGCSTSLLHDSCCSTDPALIWTFGQHTVEPAHTMSVSGHLETAAADLPCPQLPAAQHSRPLNCLSCA